MRLLGVLIFGFIVAFGVGWLAGFSYQTDWLAALILSSAAYISLQVDELFALVWQDIGDRKADARPRMPQPL